MTEEHPLQPLIDATQPYLAAINQMDESFKAMVKILNEVKGAAELLLDAHNQLLVAAGLKADDSVIFADKDEDGTDEFLLKQDKQAIHAAIKAIAENGKKDKLRAALSHHKMMASGDTPETIKQKINFCPDWQKIRALLVDLKAIQF